jgi:hypothetical protein
MAVRAQGPIEVVRHVFARQIGDHPDAIERKAARRGAFGHPAGFHFHTLAPPARRRRFLRGGLRDVIDGAHHTYVMLP